MFIDLFKKFKFNQSQKYCDIFEFLILYIQYSTCKVYVCYLDVTGESDIKSRKHFGYT